MDPTLSGFALGLLFGAAKIGLIASVGFGIAWWRTRRRLRQLEASLPEPGQLESRLASLEASADYTAARLDQLLEAQSFLSERLLQSDRKLPPGQAAGSAITP
jgi:hypothetical protein